MTNTNENRSVAVIVQEAETDIDLIFTRLNRDLASKVMCIDSISTHMQEIRRTFDINPEIVFDTRISLTAQR